MTRRSKMIISILMITLFTLQFALPVIAVDEVNYFCVDIKPGSDPNGVNIGKKGVLPVAILGHDIFDVTDIDPDTIVILNGTKGVPALRFAYEDVDKDGYMDMIFHFYTPDLGITLFTEGLDLTGELYDGSLYSGWDAIKVVGKEKK